MQPIHTKRRSLATGLAAAVAIATLGCASTQSSDEPAVFTEEQPRATGSGYGDLRTGSEFEVELDRQIRSDEAERGDPWRGIVTRDVSDPDGQVLLPRGAVVSGIVTRAGEVEIEGETRQVIALLPETLEVRGEEVPIRAEVVDADAETTADRLSGRNIAIVGGSTVAGAILGEILFDESLLGAIVGAAGGTVVAVATEDTVIELDEGSVLTLRLEEPVRVAAGR